MTKTWNGGSREAAMEYARQMTARMVRQGATICARCNGKGTMVADRDGLCRDCRGSGAIVPPEGLRLEGTTP